MTLKEKTIEKIENRGVKLQDIVNLIWKLQKEYRSDLTKKECAEALNKVLTKREVLYAILTGLAIDDAVKKNKFDKTINHIIYNDEGLYGIDEILALSIVNVYGSIALTNFGYLDKIKPGIIGIIDKKENDCNTFFDDLICAIVASSCAKIAHQNT